VEAAATADEAGVVGVAEGQEEDHEPEAESEPAGVFMHRFLFCNRLVSSSGSQEG